MSDSRSADESASRAAVSNPSIASIGVGGGRSGSLDAGGSMTATRLRSKRVPPVDARRSAIASSSNVSICRTSATL
jgi:hypothetical protein